MKKKFIIIATILSGTALFMSSCLKDNSHYVDFSKGGTYVDFPLGGYLNFASETITEAPADSVNGQPNTKGAITRVFAVNVASANLPTSPTTVTLAIGTQTDVDKLNTLQSNVHYELMPTNAYSFPQTKVTVPAGQQYANTSVTFYKALLDPSKSYVLPIYIADGGGQKLSSNLNIMYFHFIGNDFAGIYNYNFQRWQNGTGVGNPDYNINEGTVSLNPISANEFQMVTAYNGQGVNYDVTFTRTVDGSGVAHYSNWSVTFLSGDIAKWTAAGITNMQAPVFVTAPPATSNDPKVFKLQYVSGGAFGRWIVDTYTK